MERLLQLFEFSYPNGHLFLDRGGAVCRRLREASPGLEIKSIGESQIDLQWPDREIDLYFGISTAAIQTTAVDQTDFGVMAAGFASILTDTFELTTIQSFRVRQVVGRPCTSLEEAVALMRPLISSEAQEKLGRLAVPTDWRAVQAEYVQNNLTIVDRIAILDLLPRTTGLAAEARGQRSVPHITVHVDLKGFVPVAVSDLDIAALVRNVVASHLQTVVSRVAPHLLPA